MQWFNCRYGSLYYMSRLQELGRVKALKIALDLALNVFTRVLLTKTQV
jgi:hypothetical protein